MGGGECAGRESGKKSGGGGQGVKRKGVGGQISAVFTLLFKAEYFDSINLMPEPNIDSSSHVDHSHPGFIIIRGPPQAEIQLFIFSFLPPP